MEGILIREQLQRLQPQLPAGRQGWRFPDPHTFILPVAGTQLLLLNRPPDPRLEVTDERLPQAGVNGQRTGFQDLLVARAAGPLQAARQEKLDRIVRLEFGPTSGFVSQPPVTLVAELTGRNCNLILLDEKGIILGAAREVRSDRNRFRQIVSGRPYEGPPPYEKLDPYGATDEELREVLGSGALKSLRQRVDGIGPQLVRALARHTGIPEDQRPEGADLDRALNSLRDLLAGPERFVREALKQPTPAQVAREQKRQRNLQLSRSELERELTVNARRLDDLEKTRDAARKAGRLRTIGELLLTYGSQVEVGSSRVTLPDFTGLPTEIELDPAKSAMQNAQLYFERARKRENRALQANEREKELLAQRERLEETLATLEDLGDRELDELATALRGEKREQKRRGPGARYEGPHGFTVLVGRSARENDQLTFRVARSRDVWLHVQGFHGSHVIIQAQNREVPFETILFAAQLAAGHSKASDSENVPVDYTLKKNVWKVKGQPPGAVHFSQQKTVYVTPSRNPGKVQS